MPPTGFDTRALCLHFRAKCGAAAQFDEAFAGTDRFGATIDAVSLLELAGREPDVYADHRSTARDGMPMTGLRATAPPLLPPAIVLLVFAHGDHRGGRLRLYQRASRSARRHARLQADTMREADASALARTDASAAHVIERRPQGDCPDFSAMLETLEGAAARDVRHPHRAIGAALTPALDKLLDEWGDATSACCRRASDDASGARVAAAERPDVRSIRSARRERGGQCRRRECAIGDVAEHDAAYQLR